MGPITGCLDCDATDDAKCISCDATKHFVLNAATVRGWWGWWGGEVRRAAWAGAQRRCEPRGVVR